MKNRLEPLFKTRLSQLFFILLFPGINTSCQSDNQKMLAWENREKFRHASISALVTDLNSLDTVFKLSPARKLVPASLTKLVTTATALKVLGSDFRFKTQLCYNGKIENGQLVGDLIFIGGGDPTLGSVYFEGTSQKDVFPFFYHALQQAGINSIVGNILFTNHHFSHPLYPSQRLWEDMSNYYGAPPGGFSWLDNTFKLVLSSGSQPGSLCKIKSIHPPLPGLNINCQVVASTSQKDSAYIYGHPSSKDWEVYGSIPVNQSSFVIKGALPQPGSIFVRDWLAYLNKRGIVCSGVARKVKNGYLDTAPSQVLKTLYSPELKEIISVTNHRSNNLFADALLLELGRKRKGIGTWDSGKQVVDSVWNSVFDFSDNFSLWDGSGLSPKNSLSAEGMVEVLKQMHQQNEYPQFMHSLAVGGISGTLKSVFKESALKGKVYGKSGSMAGVIGYAGYIFHQEKSYAFCVLVNHFSAPFKEMRLEISSLLEQVVLSGK